MKGTTITWKQLESGYWLIRGQGPCEYSQPPRWPAGDADFIRLHAHPEASEQFVNAAAVATKAGLNQVNVSYNTR